MSGPIVGNKWYPIAGIYGNQVKHTGEFRHPNEGEYVLIPDYVTGEWIGCKVGNNETRSYPIAKLDTRFLHTLQIKVRTKSRFTLEDDGVMEELEAMVQRWIEKYEMENGK